MSIECENKVLLSICIPSYNRSERLSFLLHSIKDCIESSNLAREKVEVVVLLDGSKDDSAEVVSVLGKNYPVSLRIHSQNNQGLAAARNKLTHLALGKYIWYLDDDMEITEFSLSGHYNWDRTLAPILSGPSFVLGDEGLALFYDFRWQHLARVGYVEEPQHLSFANTSAPRELLLSYKFSSEFKGYGFEDYELGIRLLEDEIKIAYLHSAKVIHHYEKSGFEILSNIRDEGINRVKMTRLHPVAGNFALEVEPRRFGGTLRWVCEKKLHRTLWCAAHVTRASAMFCKGKRKVRLVRFSNDMALYSGFAKQSGTPVVRNVA